MESTIIVMFPLNPTNNMLTSQPTSTGWDGSLKTHSLIDQCQNNYLAFPLLWSPNGQVMGLPEAIFPGDFFSRIWSLLTLTPILWQFERLQCYVSIFSCICTENHQSYPSSGKVWLRCQWGLSTSTPIFLCACQNSFPSTEAKLSILGRQMNWLPPERNYGA